MPDPLNNTDWYGIVEEAFMDNLRTLTQHFKYEYSVSDDDTVLSRGGDVFAIIRPGAFPFKPTGDMHEKDIDWEVVFDLFVRYKTYKESWGLFKVVRKDIINLVFPNPFMLNLKDQTDTKGVWNQTISSTERAKYFRLSDKPSVRPAFIIQNMSASISQRVSFVF